LLLRSALQAARPSAAANASQTARIAMRRFLPVQLARVINGLTSADNIAFSRAWAQV
jgi:hypothetical protein